ncbi:MAG: hypothetical protein NC350_02175 [Corallococcus sp.]|nr:hypothetical protein [Corallococcus sp.]
MVNDKKTYRITMYAVMFAVIFVAMMIDKAISLGLPSGISTAACVLLVTFAFAMLDNTWTGGVLACTFFGLASFIKGFMFPEPVPISVNPLVSVLPRVIMGFVTFGVYRLMLLVTAKMSGKKYARQTLCITVAVFFGLITNTLLYLTAVNIYKEYLGKEYDSLFVIIYTVLFTNIIPEYLISLLAVPHLVLGVRRGLKLGIDGNNGKPVKSKSALTETEQVSAEGKITAKAASGCGEEGADVSLSADIVDTSKCQTEQTVQSANAVEDKCGAYAKDGADVFAETEQNTQNGNTLDGGK